MCTERRNFPPLVLFFAESAQVRVQLKCSSRASVLPYTGGEEVPINAARTARPQCFPPSSPSPEESASAETSSRPGSDVFRGDFRTV